MAGINAESGAVLDGFAHVQQSLHKIFSTRPGARVMREWFGNPGLRLLGENATEQTVLLWFNTLFMLVELFEPRVRIIHFEVEDMDRSGFATFIMSFEYRPYAHLDWQQAKAFVSISKETVTIRDAA